MVPAEAPPVAAAPAAPLDDAEAFSPAAAEDASVSDAATAPADVEDVANPADAASPMCVVAAASPRSADAKKVFEKYIFVVVVCDVKERP